MTANANAEPSVTPAQNRAGSHFAVEVAVRIPLEAGNVKLALATPIRTSLEELLGECDIGSAEGTTSAGSAGAQPGQT